MPPSLVSLACGSTVEYESECREPERKQKMRRIRVSGWLARVSALVLICLLSGAFPNVVYGYAILAHEAIIDAAWDTNIRPLLLARFSNATPEQLKEAHAYAY